MRGGKRSTAWKPGESPVKPKGMKNKKTRLKEKLGLQNWEGLVTYIETEGATKLIDEMKKLSGKDYVTAMNGLSEFVKPKLARTELSGRDGKEIQVVHVIESNVDYKNLPDEILDQIINAKKPG